MIMGILDVEIVKGFMRMCNDGWLQGWHERNGGNLTYRMREEEVDECRPFFHAQPREWVNMGVQAGNLAGEYFITTGSGKYFRNVELDPLHSIGIVEINDRGDSWRIVWGLEDGAKPTSEFPSHFMNHSVRKAATGGANRVIYHCHATNVIALTYILPLTDRDFTRSVAERHRVPGGVPGGCGCLPVDGARRYGHCHGNFGADEDLPGSDLGPARPVRIRPGLRHGLWSGPHHRKEC